MRHALYGVLQQKACEELNRYHSGQLYSRMVGDCRTLCEKHTMILPGFVGQAVQLAAAFLTLLLLRPELAGVLVACGLAAAAVGLVLRHGLKARHLAVRRAEEQVTSCLHESLEHLELGRSMAAEEEIRRRYGQRQEVWLRERTHLRRFSVGGSGAFSLVVQLGSAAVILWGAVAIRQGTLLFGDLTAIIQLLNLFRSPIAELTGVQSRLAAVDAARERVMQLWELPEEEPGEQVEEEARCKAIVFENVTFSYDGEERPVFRNFSARVELDRWTSLTGASGRGKSTLYRLILGLFRPQSGRILLETDCGTVECSAATRRFFSFVPQTPVLFSGTLRENLLLAQPEASEDELWQALSLAECGFVRTLPEGLDTVLGENGEGISVGQRQRLAIARALLSRAQVFLLDEITSALDHETEARVLKNLRAACPAALIATHRPEALQGAEQDALDIEIGETSAT